MSTLFRRADRRRSTRFSILAVLLVAGVLATTVSPASAQPRRASNVAAQEIEVLQLGCAPDLIGDQRGVLCRWSRSTNDQLRAYQLFRIVDGDARELIATVRPNGRRAHFDTDLSAPSTVTYGVVGLNRAGRVIAQSRPVALELGADVGTLRFGCAREVIGDQRGVLCRWSESENSNTRGYLVYRSVDGDRREVIARVPVEGRNASFDADVTPGATHTYAVAAVNAAGEVLAQGGPIAIAWPSAD